MDEVEHKDLYFVLAIVAILVVFVVFSILSAPHIAKPVSLKYSNYTGCIHDFNYNESYCNPIHLDNGSWKDVRSNSNETYLNMSQ